MIELAVVIAAQGTSVLAGDALDINQFAVLEPANENMKVPVV